MFIYAIHKISLLYWEILNFVFALHLKSNLVCSVISVFGIEAQAR